MDSRYAERIKSIALEEANAAPYGRVNDMSMEPGQPATVRFGWERLKEYFEVGARYNAGHWQIAGYLDGIRLKNRRVPQKGQVGIQWCGIFATWVWIKAYVPGVYWGNPGIKGPDVKVVAGSKGIGVGDVAVMHGALVHHFILTSVDGPADNPDTVIQTVNGNSTFQGILKMSRKLKDVQYYYTLDKGFFGVLESMYGGGRA